MNNLYENYILCGFGLIVGLILGFYILPYLDERAFLKRHSDGKHACNRCKRLFCIGDDQLQYEYCPYCGEPLDYHVDTEMYKRMHSDEDAVERPNQLSDASSEGDLDETP